MSNGFKIGQFASAHVVKGVHNKTMDIMNSKFSIGGKFHIECYDPDGNLKWETDAKNGVTNVGLDNTLDVYFNATDSVGGESSGGSAGPWEWALGLIDNAGFTALAAGDTHAVHGGWVEFSAYTVSGQNKRPEWSSNAAAAQALVNPALIDYDVTGPGTVRGVFIVGGDVSGSGAGGAADEQGGSAPTPLLWATADFTAGPQAVTGGDILRVTYTVNAASA